MSLYDTSDALIAELDMEEIKYSKLDFVVIGHFARNDIFELKIVNQPEIKKE